MDTCDNSKLTKSSNMSTSSSGSRSKSSSSTPKTSNLNPDESSPIQQNKERLFQKQTKILPKSVSSKSSCGPIIPLRGKLHRIHNQNGPSSTAYLYSLSVNFDSHSDRTPENDSNLLGVSQREFELFFSRTHYEHILRLFCIMDTESRGLLRRSQIREFVALRCPVFRRRDAAIQRILSLNNPNNLMEGHNDHDTIPITKDVNTTSMSESNGNNNISNKSNFGNLISFPGVMNSHMSLSQQRFNSLSHSNINSSSPSFIPNHLRWHSTFDEVWYTVVSTSIPLSSSTSLTKNSSKILEAELSLEGWMLFCRLIALAQYQEAKSRFSAKHLQQNSEIIMVELPPPTPPPPLNLQSLLERERGKNKRMHHSSNDQLPVIASLPLPELDLNHCLIAAHDNPYTSSTSPPSSSSLPSSQTSLSMCSSSYTADGAASTTTPKMHSNSVISVTLFGACSNSSENKKTSALSSSPELSDSPLYAGEMEFVVTTVDGNHSATPTRVRVKRTMQDMEWLRETFASHQRLGGTLCGRILPPFPTQEQRVGGVFMAMNSLRNLTKWGKAKDKKWDSSEGIKKAKELERCLNYIMEHPALRTSFPLNAILKASQSGLDAAKRILENEDNCNLGSTNTHANQKTSTVLPHPNSKSKFDLSNFFSNFTEPENPNLVWIRTAAQAAMALKLHGILDATGCASASAKLQHASLPCFDTSKWWRGDYNTHNHSSSSAPENNRKGEDQSNQNENDEDQCFENGVVSIASELESDEAYDLLPSPSQVFTQTQTQMQMQMQTQTQSTPSKSNNLTDLPPKKFHYGKQNSTSVDNDIHKLYEIINTMENTLSQCRDSSRSIADARRERNSLHLSIVKGLDSWEGLRGEIVGEKALMEGLVGLEDLRGMVEDGDWTLSDALSWQSSLASSAVSAAETVRSAVRAARTALSAKTAAESAALAAQKHCSTSFATPEEARTAQTRASISRSHAIHAAVVEHEAFGAKRRAAMALAHDVNCWNEHRRREMLEMLKKNAQEQKESARASKITWVGLRKGMYGVTSFCDRMNEQNGALLLRDYDLIVDKDTKDCIRNEIVSHTNDMSQATKIIPVEHKYLTPSPLELPFSFSPPPDFQNSDERMPPSQIPFPNTSRYKREALSPLSVRSVNSDVSDRLTNSESTEENDVMTASMQSLVDGLMTWGGRFDPQDDMSLPSGMAVSIALEESGVLASQTNK